MQPGWIFVAVPGEVSDGHDFIEDAVRCGATAIVAQRPRPSHCKDVAWITLPQTRHALGPVASVVYRRPTTQLRLVGITGTNGKTTLTFLLEAIVRAAGGNPGVIGTITYRWGGRERSAGHTTPEASDLQSLFREMVDDEVTHAFIEVSSHGLDQGRLDGCHFDVGVFTNLTQDHLDYHGTMEEYFLAKQILFRRLLPTSWKPSPTAVINLDDPFGRRLAGEIVDIPVFGFGTTESYAVRPEKMVLCADSIEGAVTTPSGRVSIRSRLTGSFNLSNILAAVAVSERLGIPLPAIEEGVERVVSVPGRLERVRSDNATVFVDYAHTPHALKNVLEALKTIRTGRIITIMGCGGDRDRTKRPIMGREAAAGSDFVIVTSDNPRSEDPMDIIRQVAEGVQEYGFKLLPEPLNRSHLPSGHYRVVPDRREAIAWAVRYLERNDILLVAGKGHETYQEIKGVRYPFDDREVVGEELRNIDAKQTREAAASPERMGENCVANWMGGRS
jgi:UDP-N-acetylmuramoyl-L-alanyl-D-glutamate--2,6-diaminopimelate ligase